MSEEYDSRRKELYELNTEAWTPDYQYEVKGKLDSSLKKNTTFIKKVRTYINHDQYKGVITDILTTSLEKYLSEIIASLVEGLIKISKHDDIIAAVEVVSLLHQRFASKFTSPLLSNFLYILSNPDRQQLQQLSDQERDREEISRLSRQKNILRLLGEFNIVGIFRNLRDTTPELVPDEIMKRFGKASSESIITVMLKNILNFEIKSGNSLFIVSSYLKRFQHIFKDDNNDLLPPKVRQMIKNIFQLYSAEISNITVMLNDKVYGLKKRNIKASIRTGRILEENESELVKTEELFEKFKTGNELIASIFDIQLETINDRRDSISLDDMTNSVEVVKQKTEDEESVGYWGDIKEKNFYTKIPTLQELQEEYEERPSEELSDGEIVANLLQRLQVANDNDIDFMAIEFYRSNLLNKATSNRLLKFLIEDSDVNNLKYYTRFLKILEDPLQDVITTLRDYLDKGFRSQIYHNKLNFKNIFFFVELIKFKLVPSYVIFHKIRTLTLNIAASNNIDVLSVFYEHVGRFLLQEPEYKEFTLEMINLLREKKRSQSMTINEKLAINNLLLSINPPTINTIKTADRSVKLTDVEKYIQRLLKVELNERTANIISSEINKVDLRSNETFVVQCFSHPDLINYDNIHALAFVLKSVRKNIVIRTVDFLIENIIRGLEENDYRRNRIRMSHMKYLAELFNFKLVNFKFINAVLNKILCYGHPNNQPLPNNYSVKMDSADNYFRIQLCCLLLISIDTSANTIKRTRSKRGRSRGSRINKELLRTFFAFFQYYVFCKQQPVPVDLEFKLHDLFEKYGEIDGIERYESLGETLQKLKEIVEKKGLGAQDHFSDEDEDDDDDSEDEEIEEEDDDSDDDSEDEDEEDEEELLGDEAVAKVLSYKSTNSETGDDDDDDVNLDASVTRGDIDSRKRDTNKFADDLGKEFQKILTESYETNLKNVTLNTRHSIGNPVSIPQTKDESKITNGKLAFRLLTKNGNVAKKIELPSDAKFATSIIRERENRQRDKERIMKLALDMEN
ncbi:armadillo-type protein [Scheffersomyces coipomensis]|uniref:armadillo-type protein n=1 Tax=Scheffersomyces coipomensis TaxID=1788519 RepID=UPI00315DD64F